MGKNIVVKHYYQTSIRKNTIGLMIKKVMIAILYQSGALPKKFLIKAFPSDIAMC